MDRVQEESGRTEERFPNWDEGGAGKRVGDKYVFFRLSKTPPKRSLDGAPSGVKSAGLSGRPARVQDENPGAGGMSPTFTKDVKVGQPSPLSMSPTFTKNVKVGQPSVMGHPSGNGDR